MRNNSRIFVGAGVLGLVTLLATAGCSSAEEPSKSAESAESALGSPGCNDRGAVDLTKAVTSYTWHKPPAAPQYTQEQIEAGTKQAVLGVASCIGTVAYVVTAAAEEATVVLTPLVVAEGVGAAGAAAECGELIGTAVGQALARLFGWIGSYTAYTTYVATTAIERSGQCGWICGSHDGAIDSSTNHCWCADGQDPTACSHGPTFTPTAPAQQQPAVTGTPPATQFPNGSCYNNGNGTEVGTGSCSPGASEGVPNGKVFKCRSTAGQTRTQSWSQCPDGSTVGGCC